MNLVIVESPGKVKTIQKVLGNDFKVMSSHGHIRDLAKKSFTEKIGDKGLGDFTPNYEIPDDKKELVRELKAAASKASMVWLASDEDREGEAIAWHLYEVLGLTPENSCRIVFHEITAPAIRHAIENPRSIDLNLVDAQQARRVLDRIVGFELSPVLWRKIKPSLSAGRVQSAVVRLVVDRENEIRNFKSERFYRIDGIFATDSGAQMRTTLSKRLATADEARELLLQCTGKEFKVSRVETKPVKKNPAPPFTTSTLQQEASRKLGFPVSLTMRIAQSLYEAGLITYMRTDSLNLSDIALKQIHEVITDKLGARYAQTRRYHTKSKGAQEAHEAIRPTDAARETISGSERDRKLYALIRQRAIASQMASAEIERTTVSIEIPGRKEHFTAGGEVVTFDGFQRIYAIESDTKESAVILPKVTAGSTVDAVSISATERFTTPPARYTEGTLIDKMEEIGIGRPSTYAPTVSTIQQREYVERGDREGQPRQYERMTLNPATGAITSEELTENVGADRGKLLPTDTGMVVNEFLDQYFPDILDYNFTANVEEKFDEIAKGEIEWHKEIDAFYDSFHPEVERALNTRTERKTGERELGIDPASGKPVSVKIGRYGPLVQIGVSDDEEKPRFASLLKGQSISTITLEDALKLFDFPRTLGDFEDKEVTVSVGRFGPYVKHAGKYVSIPKEMSAEAISLPEAIELIEAKRKAEANRIIKTFDEEPDLQVLNGRFGPYISWQKKNYKIPKTVTDASSLTLDECRNIIANQPAAKPRRTASRTKKS